MRNDDPKNDYFPIPRREYLELVAFRELAVRFAHRGLHVEAARDAARYAVDKELVRVGGATSAHELSNFDAEGLMFELANIKPHLMNPVRGTQDQTSAGPTRHPALTDPRDPTPGSAEYAKLDPLRKLQIANRVAAYDLAAKKRQQTAKAS